MNFAQRLNRSLAYGSVRAGQYFEHRKKFDEAKRFYRVTEAFDKAEAATRRGNIAFRSGDYDAAIEELSRAVAYGADTPLAYQRWARSLFEKKQWEIALAVAEEGNEKYPNDLELLKVRVWCLRRLKRPADARDALQQAIIDQPDEDIDQLTMEFLGKATPAWQRALILSSMEPRHNSDASWLYKYATILQEAGRVAEAADYFERAAMRAKSSWYAYRAAVAFELIGEMEPAERLYAQAIQWDKKHDAKRWGVGTFHEEAQRFDLALAAYVRSAEDASEMWRRAGLHARAAMMATRQLNFDAATFHFEEAMGLRPLNGEWQWEYAQMAELAGDYSKAIALANRLQWVEGMQHRPRRAELEFLRGRCLFEQGDYRAAYVELRRSLQLPEDQTAVVDEEVGVTVVGDSEVVDIDAVANANDTSAWADEIYVPMVRNSTDRVGYEGRASIASAMNLPEVELRQWRKASLLSATNSSTVAHGLSRCLMDAGLERRACEVLLDARDVQTPLPSGFHQHKEKSYAAEIAYYAEQRDNRSIIDDVILYESNLGLSIDCNPLALCRAILDSRPGEFIHVWSTVKDVPIPADLAAREDVLVIRKDSRQYKRLLARAKYLVNNSTFPTYFTRRDEQRYLMTWHGTPLKTLGKYMPEPLVHLNMARNYLQSTYAIFPNGHTRDVLIDGCDVYGLMQGEVEITGYPRNDALVKAREHNDERAARPGPKVALVAPTWRETAGLADQVQDIRDVVAVLRAAGYEVKVRAHHYAEEEAQRLDPTLNVVPRTVSTYDLLPEVDLLVTDYSSIYFDFALTGRPIVFYVRDWDEYAEQRGMFFGPEHLPGPACATLEELRAAVANPVVDVKQRREFLEEFGPREDGHSSYDIAEKFLSDSCTMEEPHPGILLRPSLIPNGMSSSFVNIASELSRRGEQITVLTEGRPVQTDAGREAMMRKLPEDVRVLGRVGAMPRTRLELHVDRMASKLSSGLAPAAAAVLDGMFRREAMRTLPTPNFSAVVEFDGYSEFMARLVLAIGENSERTGIYLHNSIANEIDLRMPELAGVVRLLPRFGSVISVSEGLKEENISGLCERFSIGSSNFTFARNAIQPEELRRLALEELPEAVDPEIFERGPVFVHVGRFSPEKNHKLLVEAFAEHLRSHPTSTLVMLGDGPSRIEIESQVARLPERDRFVFAGWVSNPYPVISKAQALVMPSLHEGQPMVILEARTLGTTVVGSAIPSIEAMGEDGAQFIVPLALAPWVAALNEVADQSKNETPEFDAEVYVQATVEEFYRALGL